MIAEHDTQKLLLKRKMIDISKNCAIRRLMKRVLVQITATLTILCDSKSLVVISDYVEL